jgi:hypothetical protein
MPQSFFEYVGQKIAGHLIPWDQKDISICRSLGSAVDEWGGMINSSDVMLTVEFSRLCEWSVNKMSPEDRKSYISSSVTCQMVLYLPEESEFLFYGTFFRAVAPRRLSFPGAKRGLCEAGAVRKHIVWYHPFIFPACKLLEQRKTGISIAIAPLLAVPLGLLAVLMCRPQCAGAATRGFREAFVRLSGYVRTRDTCVLFWLCFFCCFSLSPNFHGIFWGTSSGWIEYRYSHARLS